VRKTAFALGLLAALMIGYQGQRYLMGFTWAAIHGAGVLSVMPLWPVLVLEVLLWCGYVVLRKRRTAAFAAYAAVIVIGSEILLQGTPLKAWRQHRVIRQVQVRNVRDEPARAAGGALVGVRITFEAVFAETGPYFVYPTVLSTGDPGVPYEFTFGHMPPSTPSPAPGRDGRGQLFDQGVVYTFTYDLLPNFVEYDDPAKPPCVRLEPRRGSSNSELLETLSRIRPAKYSTEIEVSAPESGDRFSAVSYVTLNTYDVQAIYQEVMKRGAGRCG
jgi:hypothetical protein